MIIKKDGRSTGGLAYSTDDDFSPPLSGETLEEIVLKGEMEAFLPQSKGRMASESYGGHLYMRNATQTFKK